MNISNLLFSTLAGLTLAIAVPVFAEEGHSSTHVEHSEHQTEHHSEDHNESHHGYQRRHWTSRSWSGDHWVYVWPENAPYVGMVNPDNSNQIWACGPYGHCGWIERY
jgi:hypothetical protein